MSNGSSNSKITSAKPSTTTTTSTTSLSPQAILTMVLLAFQFGFQPGLTRKFTPSGICRSSVIMMQEIVKFFLALAMLTANGQLAPALKGWNVTSWITIAFVPAFLYSVQNMSALVAYQNLDALTFNVLNQTKTLSAALCCYLVMKQRQTRMQIVALFLLLLSALVMERIVTLDTVVGMVIPSAATSSTTKDESSSSSSRQHHWTYGVAPVLLASFLSGLAGALTQKNLQSAAGRNAYLFSMELCAASVLLLSVSFFFTSDGARILEKGLVDDTWTLWTWIPIFTNAIGGILVGLVTKYAGSVRKGFALIFGIFLSGVWQEFQQRASAAEDGGSGATPGLSTEQLVGGVLAAVSMWIHTSYRAKPTATTKAVPATTPTAAANGMNGKKTAAAAPTRRPRKTQKED